MLQDRTENFVFSVDGRVVSRSKDLRGMLRYGYKHGVAAYGYMPLEGGQGRLRVVYKDGAKFMTDFASYTVLKAWVAARKSWPQA